MRIWKRVKNSVKSTTKWQLLKIIIFLIPFGGVGLTGYEIWKLNRNK